MRYRYCKRCALRLGCSVSLSSSLLVGRKIKPMRTHHCSICNMYVCSCLAHPDSRELLCKQLRAKDGPPLPVGQHLRGLSQPQTFPALPLLHVHRCCRALYLFLHLACLRSELVLLDCRRRQLHQLADCTRAPCMAPCLSADLWRAHARTHTCRASRIQQCS